MVNLLKSSKLDKASYDKKEDITKNKINTRITIGYIAYKTKLIIGGMTSTSSL